MTMLAKSPKIAFFGTEEYSLDVLRALVDNKFSITCVITKPDSKRGRGHRLVEPPVKTFAKEHHIPVLQPQKVSEIASYIKDLQPIAGILVAYGKIIPQSIIDLFSPGIINVHPSLLPKYRGPSPIESAIINRDNETGISIMKLDAKMDAGPIYAQIHKKLSGTETKPQLYNELFNSGSDLLISILPEIMSGTLTPKAQNDADATYCKLLTKELSYINPQTMIAAEADAQVRAYLGFPRSRLKINDTELIITKAHAGASSLSPLDVQCADGNWLIIDELIAPASGKKMTAEAFLRGHQG